MPDSSSMPSLLDGFRRATAVKPGKLLMTVGREELTVGEMLDRTARLASVWAAAGLRPGDRVVLVTRDDLALATLFLGLLRAGITAVVVDPQTPAAATANLLRAAAPRGLVVDRELRAAWPTGENLFVLEVHRAGGGAAGSLFNKLLGRPPVPGAADAYPALLARHLPAELPEEFPADLIAYVMFTSGTTSRPKGVQISRRAIVAHLETLRRQFGLDPDCRLLNVLPLHHADGLVQGLLAAFWNSAAIYRPAPFTLANLGALMDAIYAGRITHFVAVPTMLSLLLKFGEEYRNILRNSDFCMVISAAAPLAEDPWRRFEEAFGVRVANVYGLTETVTGGLFCGPTDADRRLGTVGRPVDCEVRLVDEAGQEVPDGTPGELLMHGANLMAGYLNDPLETAKVLRDGWLWTGDLATRDADGFFRIVGRKKNLIIVGGANVHPERVAEVLNAHPRVLEACVFGEPDPDWGETVVAAVVPDGAAVLDEANLVRHCRSRLLPAEIPHRIHLLPTLPKGPVGKVVIARVRELIAATAVTPAESAGMATADVPGRILAIAAATFRVSPGELGPTAGPNRVSGWDSLAHLAFLMALEKAFQFRFSPREILAVETLADAERLVHEKCSG